MRTKLLLLVLVLSCAFALAAPALAQDQPVASINTAYLNVRSGPGLAYGAIATLPRGFGVNLLGRNSAGNWVLIGMTNGTQGWVNINYIYTTTRISSLPLAETSQGAPVPGTPILPSATVNSLAGQLLAGPNEMNAVIATVPLGTTVSLVGRNFDSSWVLVQLANGTRGWLPGSAVVGTVPVRALSPADGSVYAPPAPSQPTTPGGHTGYQTYVIQPGDTLFAIATRFGVTVNDLARLNGIWNPNLIYYGLTLRIPHA